MRTKSVAWWYPAKLKWDQKCVIRTACQNDCPRAPNTSSKAPAILSAVSSNCQTGARFRCRPARRSRALAENGSVLCLNRRPTPPSHSPSRRLSACISVVIEADTVTVGCPSDDLLSAPCNFSLLSRVKTGEDLSVFFVTENALKVTFPAPTPELWLAMRFVSLRPGNAGQAKVIAKSSTAADMQSDRVVMTASQLHFFSQRILRPASTRECDVSHIHAVKIAMAAVVNSYSRLCQAYARARESFCTRRLRSCWASQCALMSGCISLKWLRGSMWPASSNVRNFTSGNVRTR